MSDPPGEHLAGTAAVQASGAAEPCLCARSAPTGGDEQTPKIYNQKLQYHSLLNASNTAH